MKKENNGITLIALVITIIILIILAGITLSLVLGKNGIIEKTKEAKNKTELAKIEEQAAIDNLNEYAENLGNVFDETKGINKPKLDEGMIPIKWNGKQWEVTTEDDRDWYNYGIKEDNSDKLWANVMLSDGTYKAGNVAIGTQIEDNKLGSMFVWIPRYSYCITKGYHTNAQTYTDEISEKTGEIQVKFLRGATNVAADGTTVEQNPKLDTGNVETATKMTNYIVHPSFTNEKESGYANGGYDKELTGYWVAKFEASKEGEVQNNIASDNINNANVKVLPGVQSWRYINISNIYTVCANMVAQGNIYQLSSHVDSHMTKNSEWGAIAYLSNSQYGKTGEIWINPAGYYNTTTKIGEIYTGYASTTSPNATGNYSDTATAPPTQIDNYKTGNGIQASNTGNITGIYDLVGGSWEYVTAYLPDIQGNEYVNFFNETIPDKQKTKYVGIENSSKLTFQRNKEKFGDSLWEVTKIDKTTGNQNTWNKGFADFIYQTWPVLRRGGYFYFGATSSEFAFIGFSRRNRCYKQF